MRSGRKTVLYVALVLFAMILTILPANAASAKPALSKKKLTMYVGKSYTLKAKGFSGKVTWKSGNQKIATVSSKGKVTAKKKGTVTITAKCGKEKKTCKVTVRPVKLNKTKMTVKKGQTFRLTLKCGASKGIKWKTSKKAVVKIKSKSKNKVTLQAVKPGKATITATYKKKAYKCKVTVLKAAQQEKDPASSGTPASSDTQTPSGTPASTDKQTPSGTQTSSNTQTSSGTPTSSDTTTTSDTQGTKITEITITTGSAKKAYDGMPLKNNEITVAGFPKGKTPVITATGTITDVGTAKNTYSIDWGDLDPKNYKISENLGTLEVVPATLTVTTGSASKINDGFELTKTDGASLTGLIPGETAELTVTGSQTEVGSSDNTYDIRWVTAKETNYVVTENLGKLTVMPFSATGTEKITIDTGGHDGIYGRYHYSEGINLYLNDSDTPYPQTSNQSSGDEVTAVYSFSNGSTITVTVKGGGTDVGVHSLDCDYSTSGDTDWIRQIKITNHNIRIGKVDFYRNSGYLIYSQSDGQFFRHKVLNFDKAWKLYHSLCAQNTAPNTILDTLISKGYISGGDLISGGEPGTEDPKEYFLFGLYKLTYTYLNGSDQMYTISNFDDAWKLYHNLCGQLFEPDMILTLLKSKGYIN